MSRRYLFNVVLVLVLGGCAVPVRVTTPVPILVSPEVSGHKGVGSLGLGYAHAPSALLTPDVGTQNPNPSNPALSINETSHLFGEMGVSDGIELQLEVSKIPTLRAKFQPIGSPRNQARQGNFSAAISAGVGLANDRDSSAYESYDLNGVLLDGAAVLGYRAMDWLMFYGGMSFAHMGYSGTFQSPGRSIGPTEFSGDTFTYGPIVGLDIGGEQVHFMVGATSTFVKSGSSENNFLLGSGKLIWNFGSPRQPY